MTKMSAFRIQARKRKVNLGKVPHDCSSSTQDTDQCWRTSRQILGYVARNCLKNTKGVSGIEGGGEEEREQKGDGEEKEKKSGIHKQEARKGHGIYFPVFKDEAYLCCRISRTGWQKEKVINSNFIFAVEYGLMFNCLCVMFYCFLRCGYRFQMGR